MKRRASIADPTTPSQAWAQAHARRNFHPFRSSGSSSSRGNKDTSCRKRVKFTDLRDDPLSCRLHANSIASKVTETTRSGDPKTSEYAFFKQLKEGAGHSSDLSSKNKEGNQSDKLRSSFCSREKTSVEKSYAHLRKSLLVENCPPVNSDSFFSPVVSASKISEVFSKTAFTMMGSRSTMQENMNGLVTTLKPSRPENKHGDIFSRKRQKLRQWVIDTSFPEIDELCSNGYDFISVLLGRLTPKNNEDNISEPSKSAPQPDADPKPKLVASSESDIHFKKLYQITDNFMEVDQGQLFKDGLSSYWSDRSREKVLSDYETPISDAYKSYQQSITIKEPEYRLGRSAAISYRETKSDSDFLFEKYSSFPLCHAEDQHEFRNQNRYLLGKEPQALLLGWDSDMTKESNFSNNCQNLELITHPSPSPWDDHHQQCPNDDVASWLPTPSSSTNYRSKLYSCLPTQYHSHDFWGHTENENMDAESNHFPLTLLNRPDYLTLKEYCNYNNICKGGSLSPYPQNQNWLSSRALPDRCYYPGTEAFLFSSVYDINSAWKCLSIAGATSRELFSPTSDAEKEGISSLCLTNDKYDGFLDDSVHREDANRYSNLLNIHDLPTLYFQTSLNREVPLPLPLMLDNPNWDGFQREKLIDDGELEYC